MSRRGRDGTARELLAFLWTTQRWWMIPLVVLLLMAAPVLRREGGAD